MFRELLSKLIIWATTNDEKTNPGDVYAKMPATISADPFDSRRSISFTIYPASGGRIIQTQRYDSKTGDYIRSLYVVENNCDMAEELSQIMTAETLHI